MTIRRSPYGLVFTPALHGLALRLKSNDLTARVLMVHAGGDDHADRPAPLGGGARVVCDVIGKGDPRPGTRCRASQETT